MIASDAKFTLSRPDIVQETYLIQNLFQRSLTKYLKSPRQLELLNIE